MSFQVLKRVTGWKAQLNGEQQAQAFSATAEALPEQELSFELEVVSRACDGYQLQYRAQNAGTEVAAGNSYHLTPRAAEEAATALFGVTRDAWQTVPAVNQVGTVPARPSGDSGAKPPLPQRTR